MSFASLNIKGINDHNTVKVVKMLVESKKLKLLAILETRVKHHNVDKVVKKLTGGWNSVHNYSFH